MEHNLEKLRASAALIQAEESLISAAGTITHFGIIFAGLGLLLVFRSRQGWVWIAIGATFLVEAAWVRRARTPVASLAAGLTFAVYALWLLGSFAMAMLTKDPSYGGSIWGVFGGLVLAIGAWNFLRSYRNFRSLLNQSAPSVYRELRTLLEGMRTGQPDASSGPIEFKLRGYGDSTGAWRIKAEGGFLLLAWFSEKTFGFGGRVARLIWFVPSEVRLQREGDKWLSKDVNAKLILPNEELKIQIKPEMLDRLEAMLLPGH